MFIDTHAHLYLDKFKEDIDEVIRRCLDADIQRIYLPNIDSTHTQNMLDLEAKFPEHCFAMMGLHPCSVKENYKEELTHVEEELAKRPFKAVGEIGIDLHWDKSTFDIQVKAYEYQIQLAKDHKIPFVIHSRDSLDHTIKYVKDHQDGSLSGIFHCFNGTIDQMKAIVDLGFLVGLGGVITYKNAGLNDMIIATPIENIVLETDAPYLSPVPKRGKRNESAYIIHVAEKLAEIKELSLTNVETATTENALRLFDPALGV